MEYRIEYCEGKCCSSANGKKDLIEWLKILKDETITDIRKLYKSGASVSVRNIYKRHINQQKEMESVKK